MQSAFLSTKAATIPCNYRVSIGFSAKAPHGTSSFRTRLSLPFMPRLKSRVVFLANGLLFFALTRVAGAQTIWNTQSGDWFQTANWSDASQTRRPTHKLTMVGRLRSRPPVQRRTTSISDSAHLIRETF